MGLGPRGQVLGGARQREVGAGRARSRVSLTQGAAQNEPHEKLEREGTPQGPRKFPTGHLEGHGLLSEQHPVRPEGLGALHFRADTSRRSCLPGLLGTQAPERAPKPTQARPSAVPGGVA